MRTIKTRGESAGTGQRECRKGAFGADWIAPAWRRKGRAEDSQKNRRARPILEHTTPGWCSGAGQKPRTGTHASGKSVPFGRASECSRRPFKRRSWTPCRANWAPSLLKSGVALCCTPCSCLEDRKSEGTHLRRWREGRSGCDHRTKRSTSN